MKFEDLKKGRIYYFVGSDAYYKVIEKGIDWVCVLYYECAHYVAHPIIWHKDYDISDLVEDFDDYVEDIFDSLVYLKDMDTLKYEG